MLTAFFRTVILLVFVVLALRLMGKRQIGELQPGELVITILLSQIAATPMQDNDIPVVQTLVCILTLAGAELLLSVLAMKSLRVRTLIDGNSVTVLRDGKIDQAALGKLGFTIDDLMEGLRQKDVFDIAEVQSAVAETNGKLSVLLKAENQPAKTKLFQKDCPEPGAPQVLIADGRVNPNALRTAHMDEKALRFLLSKERVEPGDVFLLTVDSVGKTVLVRKERGV
ncbi:MAG: DUF421 domain-containing protein [Clostridia bacterium]|nr:DUF421 domain-containing protein [Clostridia bacterium]MBQ9505959.1 DUF421 domain-containing protein [Clostridia bacterium]